MDGLVLPLDQFIELVDLAAQLLDFFFQLVARPFEPVDFRLFFALHLALGLDPLSFQTLPVLPLLSNFAFFVLDDQLQLLYPPVDFSPLLLQLALQVVLVAFHGRVEFLQKPEVPLQRFGLSLILEFLFVEKVDLVFQFIGLGLRHQVLDVQAKLLDHRVFFFQVGRQLID